MRISRTGRILIGAVILLAMVVGLAVWLWPPPRNHRLPDGTTLRVERVSFGARDQNYLPPVTLIDGLKERLAVMLPKKWAAKINVHKMTSNSSWWMTSTVHSNVNSLNVWITRRDLTNGFATLQTDAAELVGDDGCMYPATQSGGASYNRRGLSSGWPIASQMTWFTFEAYPRHQSKMRLRLYNLNSSGTNRSRELAAEFTILNPAPRATSAAGWTLEPLPIEKKFGDVSFALKSITYTTNWAESPSNSFPWNFSPNPVEILPRFAVLENGQPAAEWRPVDVGRDYFETPAVVEKQSDWEALDMELSDSSGNIAPKSFGHATSLFLSPREPGWKLAVKFYGSEHSESAPNTAWVIRGVKVPGAGEYTALPYETNLDGVLIRPVALAGPGMTTYMGEKVDKISPLSSPPSRAASYMPASQELEVDLATPHISVHFDGLQDDQRLTIRAVAPGKGEYYAQPQSYTLKTSPTNESRIPYLEQYPGPYRLNWYPLDLPADVKTVDLYFCVHRARIIDFYFKPPPQ